jgi:hypothetical protein
VQAISKHSGCLHARSDFADKNYRAIAMLCGLCPTVFWAFSNPERLFYFMKQKIEQVDDQHHKEDELYGVQGPSLESVHRQSIYSWR